MAPGWSTSGSGPTPREARDRSLRRSRSDDPRPWSARGDVPAVRLGGTNDLAALSTVRHDGVRRAADPAVEPRPAAAGDGPSRTAKDLSRCRARPRPFRGSGAWWPARSPSRSWPASRGSQGCTVRRTAPTTRAFLGHGTLVYAVDEGSGWSRLWRWDLSRGSVREGPRVRSPIELVNAVGAQQGVVGVTSRAADGDRIGSLLRFLSPSDRASPLVRGDLVSWGAQGASVVAGQARSAVGCVPTTHRDRAQDDRSRVGRTPIRPDPLRRRPVGRPGREHHVLHPALARPRRPRVGRLRPYPPRVARSRAPVDLTGERHARGAGGDVARPVDVVGDGARPGQRAAWCRLRCVVVLPRSARRPSSVPIGPRRPMGGSGVVMVVRLGPGAGRGAAGRPVRDLRDRGRARSADRATPLGGADPGIHVGDLRRRRRRLRVDGRSRFRRAGRRPRTLVDPSRSPSARRSVRLARLRSSPGWDTPRHGVVRVKVGVIGAGRAGTAVAVLL